MNVVPCFVALVTVLFGMNVPTTMGGHSKIVIVIVVVIGVFDVKFDHDHDERKILTLAGRACRMSKWEVLFDLV